MKKDLINRLKAELIKKCEKTDYELDLSYLGENKSYERIKFISPNFYKSYICFELHNVNFNYPCQGFKFDLRDDIKAYKNAEKMKAVLNKALTKKTVIHTLLSKLLF